MFMKKLWNVEKKKKIQLMWINHMPDMFSNGLFIPPTKLTNSDIKYSCPCCKL